MECALLEFPFPTITRAAATAAAAESKVIKITFCQRLTEYTRRTFRRQPATNITSRSTSFPRHYIKMLLCARVCYSMNPCRSRSHINRAQLNRNQRSFRNHLQRIRHCVRPNEHQFKWRHDFSAYASHVAAASFECHQTHTEPNQDANNPSQSRAYPNVCHSHWTFHMQPPNAYSITSRSSALTCKRDRTTWTAAAAAPPAPAWLGWPHVRRRQHRWQIRRLPTNTLPAVHRPERCPQTRSAI